jgi:hypothetical protein
MPILTPANPPSPTSAEPEALYEWALSLLAFLSDHLIQPTVRFSSGEVTLAGAPATSTTIANINVTPQSRIVLFPTTANAATLFATGNVYVSAKATATGSFAITHPADADVDNTFDYVIMHIVEV